jgi:hypothetical protein
VPTFQNVAPNEAVTIDDCNHMSDSDYSFFGSIEIVKLNGELQCFEYSGKRVPETKFFVEIT